MEMAALVSLMAAAVSAGTPLLYPPWERSSANDREC